MEWTEHISTDQNTFDLFLCHSYTHSLSHTHSLGHEYTSLCVCVCYFVR